MAGEEWGGGALAALAALATSPEAVGWRSTSTRVVAWVGGRPGAEGGCAGSARRPSRLDVAANLVAARVVVVALSVGAGLDAAVPPAAGGGGGERAVAECPPPAPAGGGHALAAPPVEAGQAAALLDAGVEGWVERLPPSAVAGGGLVAALRPLLFRAWLLRPTTSVHDCGGGHVWRCVAAAAGTYCSYRRRATGGAPPTVGGLARTCDAAEAQALGALVASIGGQPPTRTFIACADGTEATCVWVSGGIVLCEADPRAGQGRSGAA